MNVRCVLCDHRADLPTLGEACPGCGARGALRPASEASVGEGPIVGPSSVPHVLTPLSQMRTPLDSETLRETRDRVARGGRPAGPLDG